MNDMSMTMLTLKLYPGETARAEKIGRGARPLLPLPLLRTKICPYKGIPSPLPPGLQQPFNNRKEQRKDINLIKTAHVSRKNENGRPELFIRIISLLVFGKIQKLSTWDVSVSASSRRAVGNLTVVVQGIDRRDGRGQLVRLAGVIERAWARRTVKTNTSVQEEKQ